MDRKILIIVFIYPPARLITLLLVPLTALADRSEFCRQALSVAVEQVDALALSCVPVTHMPTEAQSKDARNLVCYVTAQ